MKRPSFQFYPGDWMRDAALRSCSVGARGLWADLMCVMHDGDPYGHLSVNGRGLTDQQASSICGVSLAVYRRLLAELEAAGVPARTPDGVLLSRRMVRDEEIRNRRAAGGEESLKNPHVPRPKDRGKGGVEGRSEGYPSPPSLDPSPASAPAVAVASTSSAAEALESNRLWATVLRKLPPTGGPKVHICEFLTVSLPDSQPLNTWIGVINGALDGMGGPAYTAEQIAVTCLHFPAVVADGKASWTPASFTACLGRTKREGEKPARTYPAPKGRTEATIRNAAEFAAEGHDAA